MRKRRTTEEELKAAIDKLADALEFGHLLAKTHPAGLLIAAAEEITKLREIASMKEEAVLERSEA